MGDLLTMIYDTYEDYKQLCKRLGFIPKDINDNNWIVDMRELEVSNEIINRENE